jgi:hypothetical protein
MKLTIIPGDGAVYKDNVSYPDLPLTGIPENITALQWNENSGWLEFKNESEFRRPPNENITELPAWATDAVVKWDEAYAAEQAALAAAAAAANQPATTGTTEL